MTDVLIYVGVGLVSALIIIGKIGEIINANYHPPGKHTSSDLYAVLDEISLTLKRIQESQEMALDEITATLHRMESKD